MVTQFLQHFKKSIIKNDSHVIDWTVTAADIEQVEATMDTLLQEMPTQGYKVYVMAIPIETKYTRYCDVVEDCPTQTFHTLSIIQFL